MQGKAEDTLSSLRKKEMTAAHGYDMMKSGLEDELKHEKEKLTWSIAEKAKDIQAGAKAQGDLAETSKTKAADEAYVSTLKTECETKAAEWAERQKSATEEMAVIEKAKEILTSGVKALLQVSTKKQKIDFDTDDEDDKTAGRRDKVVEILKDLASKHRSFALTQMASVAMSDPFVKIRGLIEDMVEKLLKEAQEEATHEAFCQEEMGKSTKSKDEKQTKIDEYQTRIDGASTTIAELTEAVKTLEAEVAEIDKAQAEATKVRTTENA